MLGSPAMDASQPRWFLTQDQIAALPSIIEGMSPEEETRQRQKAAAFIIQVAETINGSKGRKITQLCISTAIVFMQRFFTVHSMNRFNVRDVATMCLFLASKSEESPLRLEYFIKAWWFLKFGGQVTLDSKRFQDANALLLAIENCVIHTLAFDLAIPLPHAFVLNAMKALQIDRTVINIAYYGFATGILHVTNWAIRYSAATIACVCIQLACSWARVVIRTTAKPWYQVVAPNLTEEQLQAMVDEFTRTMQTCPSTSKKIFDKGLEKNPGSSTENSPQTASQRSSASSQSSQPSSQRASFAEPSLGQQTLSLPPAPPRLVELNVNPHKMRPDEQRRSLPAWNHPQQFQGVTRRLSFTNPNPHHRKRVHDRVPESQTNGFNCKSAKFSYSANPLDVFGPL
ncbi:hypothetical protein L596_009852 [Steinernema carpocapsae]|uniref:Cyclin N-terminal domain-containing protein n=1 Tax=Steinernema carpocapsae TaxID=34508 RepID=A0A4U5PGJ7_STECR|nr:hypothetical protein L596_009852 [Steinernema carpocapsae]